MKKRLMAVALTVCLLLSMLGGMILPASAEAGYVPYAHEMGEYPDARTLRVASQQDLEYLSDVVCAGSRLEGYTLLQVADITMSGEFIPIGENYDNDGDYNFSNSFKGTYDGQGYTISNLVINLPSVNGVGLFGSAIGATIKDVGIESGSITGNNRVGSIAGYADNSSIINCYNKASVNSTGGVDGTGGIAGVSRSHAYIYGCANFGTVTAQKWAVGGISGWGQGNLTLKGCYSGGALNITDPKEDDHMGIDVIARNGSDSGASYPDSVYLAGITKDSDNAWGAQKVDTLEAGRIAYMLNTAQGFNTDRFTVDESGNIIFRQEGDPFIVEVTQRLLRSGVRLESTALYFGGAESYTVPESVNGSAVLSAAVNGKTYAVGEEIALNNKDLIIDLTMEGTYPSVTEANTVSSAVYTVSTADELAEMAEIVNNGNNFKDATVYVTADLDFSNYTTWEPIGFLTESPGGVPNEGATPFSGTFDGQYYHFKNIDFKQSGQYQALFRFVENALVQNIVIDKGTLWSDNVRPAGIISMAHDSTVRNIESHLDVFTNVNNNAKNAALVALTPGTTVESCINYGSMGYDGAPERQENAGITGYGYGANTLRNNIVAGPVFGEGSELIGRGSGTVTNCYSLPNLGLKGSLTWDQLLSGEAAWLLNTFSGTQSNTGLWSQSKDGPVLDPDHPVYRVTFQPTDSYNELLDEFYGYYSEGMEITLPEVPGYNLVAAYDNGVEVDENWLMNGYDTEIMLVLENKTFSVRYVLNGGTFLQEPKNSFVAGYSQALAAADTVKNGTLSFAGWYDNEALEGEPVDMIPADMSHGMVYYAAWEKPIEISSAAELCGITDMNGHYVMTKDIDLTGVNFTPIGSNNNPFKGSFNGNGYTINGLTLETTDNYQGLFGYNEGVIRNVTLADDCIVYGNVNVGGIAGMNTGLISGCVSNAIIASNAGNVNEYKIWSQNLCQWGGSSRMPAMLQRYNAFKPDLACFQEASETWNKYIATNFADYTLHYKYRGDKESCPVAWNNKKFEVIESGHFWLSETPEKQSMGWDAACYRICSWAVLKDKQTGQMLAIYSVHLDHVGVVARREGCLVIRERIYDLRDRYPGIILFAAGDFNCGENSEAYEVFTTGGMADTRYMTTNTSNMMTHGDINGGGLTSTIDFITTYEDAVEVTKFDVLDELRNNLRPSDHAGLLATFHAKSAINYGALAGKNDGTVSYSGVESLVMGGEYAGLAVGQNNGTVQDVFYKKMEGINAGASDPSGTKDTEGYIPMQAMDLRTVYELNRKAGEDILTIQGGKLAPVGDRDLPVPVKVTVNNREEYMLSGSSYTIDTAGYARPVVTLNGAILNDMNITIPKGDCEILIQENEGCTQHDFSLFQAVDETVHWKVCANNPAHYLDEAHRFKTVNVGSGCYEAGYVAKICQDCGYEILLDETPAEGHVFGAWQPFDAKDHQRACEKDHTHVEYAPHTFDEGTEWEASCGEFGFIRYECVCGYYYDEINAARQGESHEWETEEIDPTCEEGGGLRTFCDVCGRSSLEETSPALNHDWSDWVSADSASHKSTCRNSKDHVRTEPHKMDGGVVVDPACEQQGYTRHSCITCDYYEDTDFTAALTHEWGEWSVSKNASASVSGELKRQCSVCEGYDYRVIPSGVDAAVVAEADTSEAGFVTVAVKLQNNPGLSSLQLQLTYDPEVLQPLNGSMEKGIALGSLTFGSGFEGTLNGSFKATWVGASDDATNGTLFSVRFKVLENTETTIGVRVVPNTAFDEELKAVTLYDKDAVVVAHAHDFKWNEVSGKFECSCGGQGGNDGDLNRDGNLDVADATLLLQYLVGYTDLRIDVVAADFSGDGHVSIYDAVQLIRYLAA